LCADQQHENQLWWRKPVLILFFIQFFFVDIQHKYIYE
jgi:hypothetical protein